MVEKLDEKVGLEEFNIYENINAVALDNICGEFFFCFILMQRVNEWFFFVETAMGVQINAQDNPNQKYIKAVQE